MERRESRSIQKEIKQNDKAKPVVFHTLITEHFSDLGCIGFSQI